MRRIAIILLACLTLAACTEDEGSEFKLELSGANEVCDDADACGGDGSGTASVTLDADEEEVCYELSLSGLQNVIASHIHEGAEGESGDPVVTLTDVSDEGGSGCVEADEGSIEDILGEPESYYLNVHTKKLPDGAARAQLSS